MLSRMNALRNLALRRAAAVTALNLAARSRSVAAAAPLAKSFAAHQTLVPARSFSQTTKLNSPNSFNVQDEEDFQTRVIKNKKIVIVDFHAKWCGPCKMLGPRLEKIMAGHESKADFAKIDIDQLADLASKFEVQSVPTVMAFKNGKAVGKFVGLLDESRIQKFVQDAIDK